MAEALWRELTEAGVWWADGFSDAELAEAIVDRVLRAECMRGGFASGSVLLRRASTLPRARRFSNGTARRTTTHFGNGLVFANAVTDAQIKVLNKNAWESFKEMNPQPATRD